MYSLYLHNSKKQSGEYTSEVLKKTLKNHICENPIDATHILVSICDITELVEIKKARTYGKPIITGGFISETPIINELSDYVWHGEVFGFAEMLKAGMSLEEMPHITTPKNRRLEIYTRIDWQTIPIVNVGSKASYVYASKGCKQRCKFCLLGYSRPIDIIPEEYYRSIEKSIKQAGRNLMPIGAYDPYRKPTDKRRITEIMVKSYLREPHLSLSNMSLIRCGVEFFGDEDSRLIGKGVSSDDLYHALSLSKKYKHRMIIYFLSGLETPETIESGIEKLPYDYDRTPDVRFVFTQIDPQPNTPMFDFDITKKHDINHKNTYWKCSAINKRISVQQTNFNNATLRTLLQRIVSKGQYEAIRKRKKHNEMIDTASRIDGRLLGTASLLDIKKRKRSDDYIGKTVIPYWEQT